MKKMQNFAVAGMFAASLAVPAFAIEAEPGVSGAPALHEPGGALRLPQELGAQQRITGTVSDIDRTTGAMTLTYPDGVLTVHYPPQSIRDLQKGETVTAQFALVKPAIPGGMTQSYDAPKGTGEHRMNGTVESVDHDKGWLHITTEYGPLQLRFAPDLVRGINKGEHVTIDLAFTKGA